MRNRSIVFRAACVLLAALIMVGISAPLKLDAQPSAADYLSASQGDFAVKYTADESEVILCSYTGTATEIAVPDAVDGHTITAVSFDTLSTRDTVTSISLPEGVHSIGDSCFSACSLLETVTAAGAINEIGDYAFWKCKNLTSFPFSPELADVGAYAFYYCSALAAADISACALTEIKPYTFAYCSALEQVLLPADAAILGEYAFSNCSALGSVTLPETLLSLGEGVFLNCKLLASVSLPSGLYAIPDRAFSFCTALESISFPQNLRVIGCNAFEGSGLTAPHFPALLETIQTSAFKASAVSGEITFPQSITYIGDYSFYQTGVTKATFTSRRTVFGTYTGAFAFSGCAFLKDVSFNSDGYYNMGEGCFAGCTALEKVALAPCSGIAASMFNGCSALTSVEGGENIWYALDSAFAGCEKLYDICLDRLIFAAPGAFMGCAALKRTTVSGEAGKITVSKSAFKNCLSLGTAIIGSGVRIIDDEAFANCADLETAVIADSVTNISPTAFDGCPNLTIVCSNESSYAYSYAMQNGISVTTLVIAPIPNQTYTGKRIEPALTVSASGKKLTKNTDYTVSYSSNLNTGTAYATVTGKGDFSILTSRANFTIVAKDIAQLSISPIPAQKRTGDPVEPGVTIKNGTQQLTEGFDYTVTYSDNVKAGTAKVTIKGRGNYKGTAQTSFEITGSPFMMFLSSIFSIFGKIFGIFF